MQFPTMMFLSAAFATSLFAQTGAALGIQPGDHAVCFTVKAEQRSFLGAVLVSLDGTLVQTKGLPPLLGDSAMLSVGFTSTGRFAVAIPNSALPLGQSIYAQGAAITREELAVTSVVRVELVKKAHQPTLVLRKRREIPEAQPDADASYVPHKEKRDALAGSGQRAIPVIRPASPKSWPDSRF